MMFIAAVAILLLVLSIVPGAASSPPLGVEFEVPTTFPPPPAIIPSFGPFTATGPAVDAGIVCGSGDTIDVSGKVSGSQGQRGENYQIVKLFTCDDGSGEFLVKLQVRNDHKGDNFNWVIVGGSGDYEKLHGTGKGIGLPMTGGILDLYSGAAHID
jgi:hypothetical protein